MIEFLKISDKCNIYIFSLILKYFANILVFNQVNDNCSQNVSIIGL